MCRSYISALSFLIPFIIADFPTNLTSFVKICFVSGAGLYFAFELQIQLLLAEETLPNQSTRIAAQYDDGQGNITFRLFPAPDQVYNVVLEFQNAAQLFTSTTQTWSPIPDFL